MAVPPKRIFEQIGALREEVQGLWDSACNLLREEKKAVAQVRVACTTETEQAEAAAAAVRIFEMYWRADTELLAWYADIAIPNAERSLNEARTRAGLGPVHWPCEKLYEMHDSNLRECPCRTRRPHTPMTE